MEVFFEALLSPGFVFGLSDDTAFPCATWSSVWAAPVLGCRVVDETLAVEADVSVDVSEALRLLAVPDAWEVVRFRDGLEPSDTSDVVHLSPATAFIGDGMAVRGRPGSDWIDTCGEVGLSPRSSGVVRPPPSLAVSGTLFEILDASLLATSDAGACGGSSFRLFEGGVVGSVDLATFVGEGSEC